MRTFARLDRLPPYVFATVNKIKMDARHAGEDIIDLGMGNPDIGTPQHIVDKLTEAAQKPQNHRYSASMGITKLRMAISGWYKRRYDVDIDPDTEAIVTIGVKEGMSHLVLVTIRPGDVVSVSAKQRYFITGEISKPGQYDLSPGMTLMQAISQAGGQGKFASQTVEVHRGGDGDKEILAFDLSHIRKGKAPDPAIEAGDVRLQALHQGTVQLHPVGLAVGMLDVNVDIDATATQALAHATAPTRRHGDGDRFMKTRPRTSTGRLYRPFAITISVAM